jgi:hypothetical protein
MPTPVIENTSQTTQASLYAAQTADVTPPAYFAEALDDAERLLKFAAETGIAVDDTTRDSVLQARTASVTGWTEPTVARLLTALTNLAGLVRPATAASLKACDDETTPTVRSYLRVAIILAVFIVPFSIASFVESAISNAVRTDIATANDLAVKLRSQLGTPATTGPSAANPAVPTRSLAEPPPGMSTSEAVAELQQYAATIRSIDARSRQLNWFVFGVERDPFAAIRKEPTKLRLVFELPSALPNLALAADDRTTVFQQVRYFGQDVLDDVSIFYGAITTCILPVLYALLGTCAYLLRNFEQQMSARTFLPSNANSARFLIAGIGGAVVGLFNNFNVTQGASIPPLAIAFLVGYAVDVFFAFLEGLLQTFSRVPGTAAQTPPQSKST